MAKYVNFIVPLAVYPFDVMISVGETDHQLKDRMKRYGVPWDDRLLMKSTDRGRYCMTDDNKSIIRLPKWPKTPGDFGNLQHEIFHAAVHVMNRMGAKLRIGSSEESYAYLIGYITERVYSKIFS